MFEPPESILKICSIIDRSLSNFVSAKNEISIGKYEYEVTAFMNLSHSVRLLGSIVELGRKDLVYVMPSLILSRSVFEGLAKTTWILLPSDNLERESRYVAHLQTEVDYLNKCLSFFPDELQKENLRKELTSVQNFKNGLTRLLVDSGYQIPNLPNFRELLKGLKEENKYLLYVQLSQFAHFSHSSAIIYQKNLGINKVLDEKENIDLWRLSFGTAFPIFKVSSEIFFECIGKPVTICQPDDFEKFRQLIS